MGCSYPFYFDFYTCSFNNHIALQNKQWLTGMKRYKAVFFDAGNTLLYTSPSVAEIYFTVAKEHGCQASVEEIREASKKAYLELKTTLLTTNPDHRASDEEDQKWWSKVVTATFQQLGFSQHIDKIIETLIGTFRNPEIWRLFPEVTEVLFQLKSKGYKLGIISNWSSALLSLCKALELEPYLDAILVSAVVGWEKPSPFIFQKALSTMGISSEEALHVGDTYRDDILGAQNVGMDAILIDRLNATSLDGLIDRSCSRSNSYRRIKDLRELYPLVHCL